MKTHNFSLTVKGGAAEVEVSNRDCLSIIWQEIMQQTGSPDDAGCDWCTDTNGNTYIAHDWGWCVSTGPLVAAMVDTANYMTLGHTLKMRPDPAMGVDYSEPVFPAGSNCGGEYPR